MNAFQNFIYVLVDNNLNLASVYPNFQEAYEQIEQREKGKVIYDCSKDDGSFHKFEFEAISLSKSSWGYFVIKNRYTIHRCLLTVCPSDYTVSYDTVKRMIKAYENKKRGNYRTIGDVM